jgi:hypothetical protein
MTSKIKKTSNYDNDPNSIFGASKRVIQEYRKTIDSGKEAPTPFKQGEKSQQKSDVVGNLNEFTSLIKTITLGLNNVDGYITSQAEKGIEGSGMYRYRGGVKFNNANEARDYLINKYGNQKSGTKFSDEDREIVKKYKLVDTMKLGAIKKADRILGLIEQQTTSDEGKTYRFVDEPKKETPATIGQAEFEDDILDLEFRELVGDESLNAVAETEPRFTKKPLPIDIVGGDPDQDPEEVRQQESVFRRWRAPTEDEGEGDEEEMQGYNELLVEGDEPIETYANTPPDSEEDEPDIDPETDIEDVIRKGQKAPTENYLITLISTIVNQINKAQDIWEQNISPNITSIPKIKMDSFINSKVIKEFEDIIAKLESNATTLTVKYHYNFLDKVFTRLISSLDEIFNVINLDIKKYSSGVYISGGFVPLKSRYNPFVNASTTKYLM